MSRAELLDLLIFLLQRYYFILISDILFQSILLINLEFAYIFSSLGYFCQVFSFLRCIFLFISLFFIFALPTIKTTDMKNNTKEWIQYGTAIGMLISGVILTFLCFFLNHYKIEVEVLWYVAQCITFAGAVFRASVSRQR